MYRMAHVQTEQARERQQEAVSIRDRPVEVVCTKERRCCVLRREERGILQVRERVARKLPVPGTPDRVVLLSWSASREPLNQNVMRVDRHGNVAWRASLPGKAKSDCFVRLAADDDHFLATTYSGWVVRLDAEGQVQSISREPAATA